MAEVSTHPCAWKPCVSPGCPHLVQVLFGTQLTSAPLPMHCGKCPSRSPRDSWAARLYHVNGFLIIALDLSISPCISVGICFTETLFRYYKIQSLKVYNSVSFLFTRLCNHHHYFISEHFHHPIKNPHTHGQSLPSPRSPSPWQSLIFLPLWICPL